VLDTLLIPLCFLFNLHRVNESSIPDVTVSEGEVSKLFGDCEFRSDPSDIFLSPSSHTPPLTTLISDNTLKLLYYTMTEAAAGSSSETVQAPPQMPAHLAQKLESEQQQFEKQSVPSPLTLLQCMDYCTVYYTVCNPFCTPKLTTKRGPTQRFLPLSLFCSL
jgi:hypothetical protein